jgi:hypothetical protein
VVTVDVLAEDATRAVDVVARRGHDRGKESGGVVARGGGVEASGDAAELRPWPARARQHKRKEEKGAKVCGGRWGDGAEKRLLGFYTAEARVGASCDL